MFRYFLFETLESFYSFLFKEKSRTEKSEEKEEEATEEQNEPTATEMKRVPMNAYYYPQSDTYDITPRIQNQNEPN